MDQMKENYLTHMNLGFEDDDMMFPVIDGITFLCRGRTQTEADDYKMLYIRAKNVRLLT